MHCVILGFNLAHQRNTPAAEKFHEALLDAAGLDDETVVLDMYCGIGTIGLLLAEVCTDFGVSSFLCLFLYS